MPDYYFYPVTHKNITINKKYLFLKTLDVEKLIYIILALFRMGGQKGSSTNVGLSTHDFLTFSFNPFATLV